MLYGVIWNALAVVSGGIIGTFFKERLNEKHKVILMQSLALGVVYVGVDGLFSGHSTIFIILSLTIGALVGEWIDFNQKIVTISKRIGKRLQTKGNVAEGFINATLFICPGAMAIVGSLQSGLTGSNEILYVKAIIDLVFVVILASTSGIGVGLSSISVFLYESFLTISASLMSSYLSDIVVDEVACVGSLLMLALGLNMLDITNIKIANLILSPFIPIFLYALF